MVVATRMTAVMVIYGDCNGDRVDVDDDVADDDHDMTTDSMIFFYIFVGGNQDDREQARRRGLLDVDLLLPASHAKPQLL